MNIILVKCVLNHGVSPPVQLTCNAEVECLYGIAQVVGDVDQVEPCVLMCEVEQVKDAIRRLQWLSVVLSEQGEGCWRKAVESCARDGHILATY